MPTDLNTVTSPFLVSSSPSLQSRFSTNRPISTISPAFRPAAMSSPASIAHALTESTTIISARLMRPQSTSIMLGLKLPTRFRSHLHDLRHFGRWSYRPTQVLRVRREGEIHAIQTTGFPNVHSSND
ncbi:hypothetical protein M404DRAFT_391208 [Pisolithus tinctorius Marx 270]|uniref:Uncharacterized protein n=1 Tax=Pisolithus tinctorius Marx 270 TaxID=870435 RepID=A0A0C3P3R1_PISTI|nr:hypothetical protein M404DRAFT_391208 [Pisolithus tinctorius Marx 270]